MFDELFTIPSAWTASSLKNNPDWTYHFTNTELAEIDHTLNIYKQNPDNADFLLPSLQNKFTEFSAQLENGLGTVFVKGIPTEKYDDNDLALIFSGIGYYLGQSVSQSTKGEHLHQVKDDGYSFSDKRARGTNTSFKLWFHNDPCDVAGLMCVRKAHSGGESQIVSSVSIHNEMLKTAPELLKLLYEPYYFKRHNVNTTQALAYHAKPIMAYHQGKFICNILRPLIDQAQRLDDVPKMTHQQIAALDLLESLAQSEKLCVQFTLQPGDILFFNNFEILHSRLEFKDAEDIALKRCLHRLWLSTKTSRELPESFLPIYHDVRAGHYRGGILPEEHQ